ncbi:MAG: hypothetical protein GF398_10590 [Chitinivibrionales bacterium]|nr:hypothetical protein [Chitinivibrionales bacterium]
MIRAWLAAVLSGYLSLQATSLDSGFFYYRCGDYDKAQAIFTQAYASAPNAPKALLGYAYIQPDGKSAAAKFQRLIDHEKAGDSLKANASKRLGDYYAIRKDWHNALEYYSLATRYGVDQLLPQRIFAVRSKLVAQAPGVYTLQIGSFGSIDNARSLKNELFQTLDNVYIQKVEIKSKPYFRVRVGSFASEADAEAFAHEKLRSHTGKVVKK